MNDSFNTPSSRDPFQFELFEAVKKYKKRANNNEDDILNNSFNAELNIKMSKYSSKPKQKQGSSICVSDSPDKEANYFDQHVIDEKNNKENLMRDDFLNAFLDQDASRKDLNTVPIPLPRSKTNKDTSPHHCSPKLIEKEPNQPSIDEVVKKKKKNSRHFKETKQKDEQKNEKIKSKLASNESTMIEQESTKQPNMKSDDVANMSALEKFNLYMESQKSSVTTESKEILSDKKIPGQSAKPGFNLKDYEKSEKYQDNNNILLTSTSKVDKSSTDKGGSILDKFNSYLQKDKKETSESDLYNQIEERNRLLNKKPEPSPRNISSNAPSKPKSQHTATKNGIDNDFLPNSKYEKAHHLEKDITDKLKSQELYETNNFKEVEKINHRQDILKTPKNISSREQTDERFDNSLHQNGNHVVHQNKPNPDIKRNSSVDNLFEAESNKKVTAKQYDLSSKDLHVMNTSSDDADTKKSYNNQKEKDKINSKTNIKVSEDQKKSPRKTKREKSFSEKKELDERIISLKGSNAIDSNSSSQSMQRKNSLKTVHSEKSQTPDIVRKKKSLEKKNSFNGIQKKVNSSGELPLKRNSPMKATVDSDNVSKQENKNVLINKTLSSSSKRKSKSFTNISNIAPSTPKSLPDDNQNFNSVSLREQIYFDWLQQKNALSKNDIKQKLAATRKHDEEKEYNAKEKKVIATKTYNAWFENKTDKLKHNQRERKNKKVTENGKEEEKEQRKRDAKKFFESWKQQKDVKLKDQYKKNKTEIMEKKKKEIEDKIERTNDSTKVFENWKSKKDESLKEKSRRQKAERKEKEKKESEKREREKTAQIVFESWKEEKKSRPSSACTSPSLKQRAWRPSSRNSTSVIPASVQPVVLRNAPPTRHRTMSAGGRLQDTKRVK